MTSSVDCYTNVSAECGHLFTVLLSVILMNVTLLNVVAPLRSPDDADDGVNMCFCLVRTKTPFKELLKATMTFLQMRRTLEKYSKN